MHTKKNARKDELKIREEGSKITGELPAHAGDEDVVPAVLRRVVGATVT